MARVLDPGEWLVSVSSERHVGEVGLYELRISGLVAQFAEPILDSVSGAGTVALMFTEPVTGVDISDFRLTRHNYITPVDLHPEEESIDITGAALTGSGTDYVVDLTSIPRRAGEYRVSLIASGSEIASAGGTLIGDATRSWTRPLGDVETVDAMAALVSGAAISSVTIVTHGFAKFGNGRSYLQAKWMKRPRIPIDGEPYKLWIVGRAINRKQC